MPLVGLAGGSVNGYWRFLSESNVCGCEETASDFTF